MSNLGLRSGNRKSRSSSLELATGFCKCVDYRKQLRKSPSIDYKLFYSIEARKIKRTEYDF